MRKIRRRSHNYGARFYDPVIGRWGSVDPLAGVAPNWSPYRAFYNNPLFWTDPTGMLEFASYSDYKKYAEENGIEVLSRSKMGSQGHWLTRHRVNNSSVWNTANQYNLQQAEGYGQYTSIAQRTSFYQWFQSTTEAQGQETMWAGAAAVVASQMAQTESGPGSWFISDAVKAFAQEGNKKIFDDVFGRLRTLYNNGEKGYVLKGDAAKQWDGQTLYREQFTIVDPLYRKQSTSTLSELSNMSTGHGFLGSVGFMMIPELKFRGNLSNPQHRYNHGMSVVVPFYQKYGFSGGPSVRFSY